MWIATSPRKVSNNGSGENAQVIRQSQAHLLHIDSSGTVREESGPKVSAPISWGLLWPKTRQQALELLGNQFFSWAFKVFLGLWGRLQPSISKTCYSQSCLVPHRLSSTHAYSKLKWVEKPLGDKHLKVSVTVFSEEPKAGTPALAAGSTGPCARRLNRIKGEKASPWIRAFSACFLPTVTGAVSAPGQSDPP